VTCSNQEKTLRQKAFQIILSLFFQHFRTKDFDRIFKLSSSPPPKALAKPLVFMISAELLTFKHVCDQISFLNRNSPEVEESLKEYHIIVVPKLLFTFKNLLETEGLDGIASHGIS
jgi:hypothetical protein